MSRSVKCAHDRLAWYRRENRRWRLVGYLSGCYRNRRYLGQWFDRLDCEDCGAWLSLGPSNDGKGSDFSVKLEIHAALMAAKLDDLEWVTERAAVWDGWNGRRYNSMPPPGLDADELHCWDVGYLACQIFMHEAMGVARG